MKFDLPEAQDGFVGVRFIRLFGALQEEPFLCHGRLSLQALGTSRRHCQPFSWQRQRHGVNGAARRHINLLYWRTARG